MISVWNLLWIVPVCFASGFTFAALCIAAKERDHERS